MSKNSKFVRLRFQRRTFIVFLVILSFDSCYSLENEGVNFQEFKETVTKDLWPDRDSSDLRAVSFHRKLLGHFRNPYIHLNSYKDRTLSTVTLSSSSVPSPTPNATKSSTSPPPRISPPAQHVSAPPPSVPVSNFHTGRRSSSSRMVLIVVGCIFGALFLLLFAIGGFTRFNRFTR